MGFCVTAVDRVLAARNNSGPPTVFNTDQGAPDFVDLPRVGLRLPLNPELEHLQWYGRGPWDNYSDRKASSTS